VQAFIATENEQSSGKRVGFYRQCANGDNRSYAPGWLTRSRIDQVCRSIKQRWMYLYGHGTMEAQVDFAECLRIGKLNRRPRIRGAGKIAFLPGKPVYGK